MDAVTEKQEKLKTAVKNFSSLTLTLLLLVVALFEMCRGMYFEYHDNMQVAEFHYIQAILSYILAKM